MIQQMSHASRQKQLSTSAGTKLLAYYKDNPWMNTQGNTCPFVYKVHIDNDFSAVAKGAVEGCRRISCSPLLENFTWDSKSVHIRHCCDASPKFSATFILAQSPLHQRRCLCYTRSFAFHLWWHQSHCSHSGGPESWVQVAPPSQAHTVVRQLPGGQPIAERRHIVYQSRNSVKRRYTGWQRICTEDSATPLDHVQVASVSKVRSVGMRCRSPCVKHSVEERSWITTATLKVLEEAQIRCGCRPGSSNRPRRRR